MITPYKSYFEEYLYRLFRRNHWNKEEEFEEDVIRLFEEWLGELRPEEWLEYGGMFANNLYKTDFNKYLGKGAL